MASINCGQSDTILLSGVGSLGDEMSRAAVGQAAPATGLRLGNLPGEGAAALLWRTAPSGLRRHHSLSDGPRGRGLAGPQKKRSQLVEALEKGWAPSPSNALEAGLVRH